VGLAAGLERTKMDSWEKNGPLLHPPRTGHGGSLRDAAWIAAVAVAAAAADYCVRRGERVLETKETGGSSPLLLLLLLLDFRLHLHLHLDSPPLCCLFLLEPPFLAQKWNPGEKKKRKKKERKGKRKERRRNVFFNFRLDHECRPRVRVANQTSIHPPSFMTNHDADFSPARNHLVLQSTASFLTARLLSSREKRSSRSTVALCG